MIFKRGATVEVLVFPDDAIVLQYGVNGFPLEMVLSLDLEEKSLLSTENPEKAGATSPKPAPDHPWRIWNKRKSQENEIPTHSISAETSEGDISPIF